MLTERVQLCDAVELIRELLDLVFTFSLTRARCRFRVGVLVDQLRDVFCRVERDALEKGIGTQVLR